MVAGAGRGVRSITVLVVLSLLAVVGLQAAQQRVASAALTPAVPYTAVAAGANHTCAITVNRTVACWGSNLFGQLGNNSTTDSTTPVAVSGLTGVTAISAGDFHTCAVASGAVKCWGFGGFGQLGTNSTSDSKTPVAFLGVTSAMGVAAGSEHTCVLYSSGGVRCAGWNSDGQLGDGTTTDAKFSVLVSGLSGVTALTAGASHTCALLSSGGVRCWGANGHGQLGDGTTTERDTPVDVIFGAAPLTGMAGVAAGANHTCARAQTGSVRCWGANDRGQLGIGTLVDKKSPSLIGSSSGVTALAGGVAHSCAVSGIGGFVSCWGANAYGQLGNGTSADARSPIIISGMSGVIGVATGANHSCAVFTRGTVKCWGGNGYGQLGNGTTNDSTTPLLVSATGSAAIITNNPLKPLTGGSFTPTVATTGDGTKSVTSSTPSVCTVAAGVVSFIALGTCTLVAHVAAGTNYASGDGSAQNLTVGQGPVTPPTTPTISNIPSAPVAFGSFTPTVSTNGDGTTSVTSSTTAVCKVTAGLVSFDHAGTCTLVPHVTAGVLHSAADGAATSITVAKATPTAPTITNIPDAAVREGTFTPTVSTNSTGTTSVTSSTTDVCFVDMQKAVVFRTLGTCMLVPKVAATSDYAAATGSAQTVSVRLTPSIQTFGLSAGSYTMCAVVAGGTAKCWGPVSLSNEWTPPTDVSGLSGVFSIAVGPQLNPLRFGPDHTCAVILGGTVKCWGANANGQLGNNSTSDSATPVEVTGVSNAIAVVAGNAHSCALIYGGVLGGTVKCWGYNHDGQLGNNSTTDSKIPVSVQGLTNVLAISVGDDHTCALIYGATVKCWGLNDYGQIGDGTKINRRTPVAVSGLAGAIGVAASADHTCALIYGGTAKCWGKNDQGLLGNGTTTDSKVPVSVSGLTTATSISTGRYSTCAVLVGDTVTCWGSADHALLGTRTESSSSPVAMPGLTDVASVAISGSMACVLSKAGVMRCWGWGIVDKVGLVERIYTEPTDAFVWSSRVIIANLPTSWKVGTSFNAIVSTTGDGTTSVTSSTPSVCMVSGNTVTVVGIGTCTLKARVAAGTKFNAADGPTQSFTGSST